MLIHWIWYATLPGLSLRQKHGVLEHFSDPEDIFHADRFDHLSGMTPDIANALKNKDLSKAKSVIKQCGEKHISILTLQDAAYPSRLRNTDDAPVVLYYKGVLPDLEGQPVISVVGTRKASAYGVKNAREMSRQIAVCGGLVVSGGAEGIDAAALQGAMDAGTQVVAVLGFGADVVYPSKNRQLFARIEENGCLLTEYVPGTGVKPWQFPERNRIISALANGVLVVEAPERSGALITARKAFEQGRDVYAVPGNIDIATCVGSNALLQDYAQAVMTGWDVLKNYAGLYPGVEKCAAELHSSSQLKVAQTPKLPALRTDTDKKDIDNPKDNAYSVLENNTKLTEQEKQILACLDSTPRPVDDVIAQLGMPAGKLLSALTMMALKGVVVNHPGRLVSAGKQIQ